MIAAIRSKKPAVARRAVRNHISSACKTAKQIMLLPKRVEELQEEASSNRHRAR